MSDTETEVSDTDTEQSAASQAPTDRLMGAAQELLKVVTERAVSAAVERVDGLSDRLGDVAENGGVGLSSALGGGQAALQGDNPVTGALKGGFTAVKDKVKGAVGLGDSSDSGGGGGGGSSGGRGKFKFMNIVEELDVGVPIRVAYDQWTQFADFSGFMKKVQSVEQEDDEKTVWRAQVFWSKRTWNATTLEQVPDSHIIWRSQGAKGYVNGIVTFHEVTPNLTKVLLVLEYYPVGFFEKTGNLWRAVGRRARLEFKHYRRHVMVESLINQEDLEGWRGEIRDSEVVKTHEEALEEEQAAEEEDSEEDYAGDEYSDEDYPEDEYSDEDYADDEYSDEDYADEDDEERPEDEQDADETDEAEPVADEDGAEPDEEPDEDDVDEGRRGRAGRRRKATAS